MGRKFIDLKGKRFNNLTVIEKSDSKDSHGVRWDCICSCGNKVPFIYGYDLRRGRTNFCHKCNHKKSKESPIKSLFGNYKRNAIKRGYSFDIDISYFKTLIRRDCYYCGTPPNQKLHKNNCKEGLIYNGIDRKDNSIGYTIENCVSCCKFCNLAKNRFNASELLDWIKRLKSK